MANHWTSGLLWQQRTNDDQNIYCIEHGGWICRSALVRDIQLLHINAFFFPFKVQCSSMALTFPMPTSLSLLFFRLSKLVKPVKLIFSSDAFVSQTLRLFSLFCRLKKKNVFVRLWSSIFKWGNPPQVWSRNYGRGSWGSNTQNPLQRQLRNKCALSTRCLPALILSACHGARGNGGVLGNSSSDLFPRLIAKLINQSNY